ncbi:unnamed protein product, partial [Brachionus calyciflorus]
FTKLPLIQEFNKVIFKKNNSKRHFPLSNILSNQIDQELDDYEPPTKKKLINIDRSSSPYYLKLNNNSNACYANSIIQAFLSLDDNFFKQVIGKEKTCEFAKNFAIFVKNYSKKKQYNYSAQSLRNYITTLSPQNNYDLPIMNCSFSFLIEILQKHDWLNVLFKFKSTLSRNCITCNYKSTFTRNHININLTRSTEIQSVSFTDLFLPTRFQWENSNCSHFDYFEEVKYYDFNDYVIIRLNNVNFIMNNDGSSSTIILNTKILNFDPNNVTISNQHFILHSAILYYHDKLHYTCVKRFNNTWIEVSDNQYTYNEKFLEHLANVYILFLKKI